ncbi:CGNR zinc finger domain-containing protein [Rhizobium sp. XQZ8]|uniref:CGNR zinc finger domain-containing protein n=1 Tax=Rhizobium populisoli TaxID=2859785 RepID=UPI001C6674F2|nr:CGNR zinc finger domain-containing protein [Rhizobium populisoli]MBW6426003.1 CGNR zinc finger domain-containing protein [Rhizobium populisoli]
MATSTSDMPLRGGNPALDFTNTLDSRIGRYGPDFLKSADDLVILAERADVIDGPTAVMLNRAISLNPERAQGNIDDSLTLREAIYAVFLSEDRDEAYPAQPLAVLFDAAERARARQRLCRGENGFTWEASVESIGDLNGLFALAAADLLIARERRRPVRECKGDNCGWLFLDTSKGGRRMWCSEASCGSHSRVKRFRSEKGR